MAADDLDEFLEAQENDEIQEMNFLGVFPSANKGPQPVKEGDCFFTMDKKEFIVIQERKVPMTGRRIGYYCHIYEIQLTPEGHKNWLYMPKVKTSKAHTPDPIKIMEARKKLRES